MVVDLARVDGAALPYEFQEELGSLTARRRPRLTALRRDTAVRTRMHQRLHRSRQKAIVDEEVLLHAEPDVVSFEVTNPVVLDTMSQYQVLRTRRRTNRVRLYKAQLIEGPFESRRSEEASGNRKAPHVVERDRHAQMLPNSMGADVKSTPEGVPSTLCLGGGFLVSETTESREEAPALSVSRLLKSPQYGPPAPIHRCPRRHRGNPRRQDGRGRG